MTDIILITQEDASINFIKKTFIIPLGLSFNNSNVYDLIINKFSSLKYLNELNEYNFDIYFGIKCEIEYTPDSEDPEELEILDNQDAEPNIQYIYCNIDKIKYFNNNTYFELFHLIDNFNNYNYGNYKTLKTCENLYVFKSEIIKNIFIDSDNNSNETFEEQFKQLNPYYIEVLNYETGDIEIQPLENDGIIVNPIYEDSQPFFKKIYDDSVEFRIIIRYISKIDLKPKLKLTDYYLKFKKTPELIEFNGDSIIPNEIFKDYKGSNKIFLNKEVIKTDENGQNILDPENPYIYVEVNNGLDYEQIPNYLKESLADQFLGHIITDEYTYIVIIGTVFYEDNKENSINYVANQTIITSEKGDENIDPNLLDNEGYIKKTLEYSKKDFEILFKFDYDEYSENYEEYANNQIYNTFYNIEDIKALDGNSELLTEIDINNGHIIKYSKPFNIYIKYEDYTFKTRYSIVIRSNNIYWKGLNLVENKLFYELNNYTNICCRSWI